MMLKPPLWYTDREREREGTWDGVWQRRRLCFVRRDEVRTWWEYSFDRGRRQSWGSIFHQNGLKNKGQGNRDVINARKVVDKTVQLVKLKGVDVKYVHQTSYDGLIALIFKNEDSWLKKWKRLLRTETDRCSTIKICVLKRYMDAEIGIIVERVRIFHINLMVEMHCFEHWCHCLTIEHLGSQFVVKYKFIFQLYCVFCFALFMSSFSYSKQKFL